MELTAEYRGNVEFEVLARGHRVTCDQPLDNGGNDKGLSPPEFLLAALATCAGYYAAEYLRVRNLTTPDLKVRVIANKAKAPARLAFFRIEVHAPGLNEQHETGLHRAVKTCLIHNTLLVPPDSVWKAAEIVQEGLKIKQIATTDLLVPEADPAQILSFLNEHDDAAALALVGHEPHVSALLAFLATGRREIFALFKKGGMALLEGDKPLQPGHLLLRWFMEPGQLMMIGEK